MIYGFYLYGKTGTCLYHLELIKYKGKSSKAEHTKFLFGLIRTLKHFVHFVSHKPLSSTYIIIYVIVKIY